MAHSNVSFVGSIPEAYHQYLGPLLFEPYAADLVGRLQLSSSTPEILELACGTGIVTERLHERFGDAAIITATDLNEAMLDVARRRLSQSARITWRAADAAALPFPDQTFDAVVCQFGLMFFPDKLQAAREALRVLKPDGQWVFNVWDSFEVNPVTRMTHETIASFFDANPPDFYLVPFGYHDVATIRALLDEAGFVDATITTVALEAVGPSAEHVATGLVRGNPVLGVIEQRGRDPQAIVTALAGALKSAFENQPLCAPMQAHVATARRPL